jgi:transposase
MLDETAALPEDPEELRAFTARLLAEVKAQAVLIEKLRHQLAGHARHRFGASSETAEQLQLALETSEIAAAAMTARLRLPDIEEKDRPRRRPIPDHVPRMEVELSPAADACADCGGRLRRIGEDVTEELEYVPGRFIVNRIVRPRLACTGCERFVQAPLPSRPIERGRPGPGLLAHVLVGKYADHLPLYRQSQIFERDGLDLDRSTLADWVGKTTALLAPLADAIGRHVLAAGAIFADDTPIRMLAPGAPARPGQPGSGPTPATSAPGAARPRRRPGIASRATARESIRRTTSPASAASCMPTATPASTNSTAPAPSARSPAWPTSAASSSTSIAPRPRRSPRRRSSVSPGSMPSRSRPVAPRPSDTNAVRGLAADRGAWANIPPRVIRKGSFAFSSWVYRQRNLVERFFNRIKQFRGLATRYDRRPEDYLAALKLAAIRIWLAAI